MKFKTILAPAVALTMALANPLQAKASAEVSPAELTTAAMGITVCLMEYGRPQEIAQKLFEMGVSKLPEQQVLNVVQNSAFQQRVKNHIVASGGCGAIVKQFETAADKALKTRF